MMTAQRPAAPGSRRRWLAVSTGLGLTEALAQVLLLRELLVGFRGNELSLGISLAAWLLWVALGSAAGGRLLRPRTAQRVTSGAWAAALSILLLGTLPLAAIWFARDLRAIFGIAWGEFIPVSRLVHATAFLIAPVGFVAGMAFPIICRAAEARAGVSPGRVYLAESLGFLVGGAATFATADIITPFAGAVVTAVVAAAFALVAAWDSRAGRYAVACWAALAAAALVLGAPARLERGSLRNLYPQQHIVASRYSRYGSWVALAHGEQVSFYHNGALAFTAPDVIAAETLAHLALLQHPRPRRVLLLGGGMDGTAAELLKYPRLRLDYVELDPAVVALAHAVGKGAQLDFEQVMSNPRLRFSRCDGRLFVKRAAAAGADYDVIIVNLPEPATALLNRFYTIEFFTEAKRALSPQGVLCVGLPSAENYIGPEMQALHGSIYHSLRRIFGEVVITPGEHSYFFASASGSFPTADAAELARRWQRRRVPTRYFGPYYLEAILLPGRVEFVRQSCESAPRAINRDFRPVGYFYNVAVVGLAEGVLAPGAVTRMRRLALPLLVLVGLALFGVPFMLSRRGERLHRGAVIGGVAAAGLAGMTLEVCLLFAFQVLRGHIYSQVGVLVAVFMAGVAAGTWIEGRALAAQRRPQRRWLAWLIAGAAVTAITPLLLSILQVSAAASGWLSAAVIAALIAAGGAMVGALFPLAVRMLGESAKAAGAVYAADVAGAAVGAFAAAVVVLPLVGLPGTCWIAAAILCAMAVVGALILGGAAALRRADL